jgi:hypothetical protein
MGLSRSTLRYGPAKVTVNAGAYTLYTEGDINLRLRKTWKDVNTALHARVDRAATDLVIEIPLKLWGAWENLTSLFPSTILTPTIGDRIFGTTDQNLIIHAKNQDQFTFHNARLTKLANLHLGIDQQMFSADVVYTALLKNNTNPESALSYMTVDTAAFSDTFVKTNYLQQRWTGAWAGVSGFTTITSQKGWDIEWQLELEPEYNANYGTIDMILKDFHARASCIPIEPSNANLFDALNLQGAGNPLGHLQSAGAQVPGNLTITGAGPHTVVLKNAVIEETGFAFGAVPLRNGPTIWGTTRGFSTPGTADGIATVT